jgi:RNA recognition motif-containing protein
VYSARSINVSSMSLVDLFTVVVVHFDQRKRKEGVFMGKKLYVGGISYNTTDDQLHDLFSSAGTVESAKIVMDRDTGRSKGFGFVEMASEAEAQSAIQKLNGSEADGRRLTVNEARPQAPRDNRGGGGGGGGRNRW